MVRVSEGKRVEGRKLDRCARTKFHKAFGIWVCFLIEKETSGDFEQGVS